MVSANQIPFTSKTSRALVLTAGAVVEFVVDELVADGTKLLLAELAHKDARLFILLCPFSHESHPAGKARAGVALNVSACERRAVET